MNYKKLIRLLDKAKKQYEDGEVIECIVTLDEVIEELNKDCKDMEK